MRLQVFQHVPFEGPGEIARWADERGHKLAFTQWFDGAAPPALGKVDGIIALGGPMNIYDYRAYPWLRDEKAYLARALVQSRPVFGACLGAQLLADVLGGKVHQNPVREIGWWPVKWRTDARAAPGWDFLPAVSMPLHWHGDTFDLPPHAHWLADSPDCPHQAFAWGRLALGLQFHLEPDATIVHDWIGQMSAEELAPGQPRVQTAEQIAAGLIQYQPDNLVLLWKLLDKWFQE
jgi:GMP synthase-like glutamine amidotransferase